MLSNEDNKQEIRSPVSSGGGAGVLSPPGRTSAKQAAVEKKKQSARMLVTLFPRVPKTATVLLEFFIKRESKVSLMRDPLSHFCQEEVVLHAQECMLKLNKQVITYQDLRDMVENLVGLHSLDPEVAKALGVTVRKLIIITGEVASSLEKIAEVSVTDWMAIGDAIITKIERMQLTKQQPFSSFIPKIRDFNSIKMLGAGGFGAVYLANYRPANLVATVKLVNVDRFSRHKQAAMDKVVASVIRNPFLVKYYSCFCVKIFVMLAFVSPSAPIQTCPTMGERVDAVQDQEPVTGTCGLHNLPSFLDVPLDGHRIVSGTTSLADSPLFPSPFKSSLLMNYSFSGHASSTSCTMPHAQLFFAPQEAYVTIMEYIAGLDLMRVVTKEEFLDIESCQIIMAQLILALEHMHLRGFLHRDIKVSNMLILPGGRVKVIDFDTTKVCSGHFSKRLLRGYFRRTPFEFHDGESAGTIPYMAPEILKRRPYAAAGASTLTEAASIKELSLPFTAATTKRPLQGTPPRPRTLRRAADWWSAGIVLYKLSTGRVPFRGKTKQALRERIVTSPLKFPRTEDHPHSATAPAKDMMYRMLKKNPVERLGSRNYNDLKTHPFFEQFDWQMLYNRTNLCEISSIAEILKADAEKGNEPDPDDQRRHLTIDEMTDIAFETQKPLLCYASGSFKKLMNAVRESKTAINISATFMDTSDFSSTPVDYRAATPGQSSVKTGLASTANEKKEGPSSSIGKVELILFRKKKYWKYWSFGFSMRRVQGEDGNFYLYVDGVKKDSPADRSQVLPLDVILSVNGTPVEDLAQARNALSACGDQLVLSVMSSSTYRVLTSRRDMMSLIRCLSKENAVLKSTPFSCITGMPYGLGVIDVSVWDDKAKRFTTVFVLTHTDVTPVGHDTVYPGDVLAQIDGVNLEGLTRDQVMKMLNTTRGDVTVSVVPMSPMRVRRILVSKLHETVMTDTNVASRTTGAEIESP
ncbi:microtubule-associated serine/threonine-protein kinase 4-like isoform X2 [Dermacentor albipictus]|uniref:microtubule-associated serine/threonine-protein kinase 4-like isoform X2 n=1 Tax=Dermacentor albipictus TaxID=60249 RepID=UPI0031FD0411